MASPYIEGTNSGLAFSSRDIDILSEKILVRIADDFTTAKFIVEYTIQSSSSSTQIPLLFLTQGFKEGFHVWLDNKKIEIQEVGDKYFDTSSFPAFSNPFQREIEISWQENETSRQQIDGLKYFEASIEKGIHTIKVEYIATPYAYRGGWLTEFWFQYSLTPAKYWKSFGKLEIIIEQKGTIRQITTNLGQSNEKEIKSVKHLDI